MLSNLLIFMDGCCFGFLVAELIVAAALMVAARED